MYALCTYYLCLIIIIEFMVDGRKKKERGWGKRLRKKEEENQNS